MSGLVDGAAFALDAPEHVAAVWGDGTSVLWAQGEPLMLVGPEGVGKTTLGQQLALKRAGIGSLDCLGHLVTPDHRRVLYLALDRPRQAARSMRRMVAERDRRLLADRLVAWQGPLPFDVADDPEQLLALAQEHGAGTVVIDSLKDIAPSLSDESTGQAINRAMQLLVADGIEVIADHHQRKAQAENKKPKALSDVYGSRWLTAGCGSVVMLWGEAGDPVVELLHLKQPADAVGPLTLLHDNRTGTTTVADKPDAASIVAGHVGPAPTAKDVARVLFGVKDPKRNDVEKARRKLDVEVDAGRLVRLPAEPGEPVAYKVAEGGSREGSRGSRKGGHGEGHAGPLRSRANVTPAHNGGHGHAQAVVIPGPWQDLPPSMPEMWEAADGDPDAERAERLAARHADLHLEATRSDKDVGILSSYKSNTPPMSAGVARRPPPSATTAQGQRIPTPPTAATRTTEAGPPPPPRAEAGPRRTGSLPLSARTNPHEGG